MHKTILLLLLGIISGILVGIFTTTYAFPITFPAKNSAPKHIIGFLPYWQIAKTDTNELDSLTTLTYFALSVDGDGHIVKLATTQEEDPGWYQLHSDAFASFLTAAKQHNVTLSLLISSGDSDSINHLVAKPIEHAKSLLKEVTPLMKKYHFTDLNLDIEDSSHASPAARMQFTTFIKTVKQLVDNEKLGTLTVEISPTDVINYNLINVSDITPYTNYIVLMAYDFHSPVSNVTGPVAPLNGAGIDSEYDVTTAVERTLQYVPSEKLILGMPLYGYEWETLNAAIRSAIIPGSGVLASNNRIESTMSNCASCSAFFDNESQEIFIEYKDAASRTFHQIFVPNKQSVQAKIAYAHKKLLSGVALWALGYESPSMLQPLINYK